MISYILSLTHEINKYDVHIKDIASRCNMENVRWRSKFNKTALYKRNCNQATDTETKSRYITKELNVHILY